MIVLNKMSLGNLETYFSLVSFTFGMFVKHVIT